MPRAQSLRALLLRRLTWPLLLIVLLDVAISYAVSLHFANRAYDRWLLDSARSLAQEVRSYKDRVSIDLPPIAVEVFRWDEVDKTFFKVESLETGFLAGDRGLPSPDMTGLEASQPLYQDEVLQGEKVRVVSVLFTPAASDERVIVSVAETLRKREGILREIILAVALPQLLLVVMALLHVWIGIKKGLKPLDDLNRMIDSRSARDLTPISDLGVPLEVRSLTHTINALLRRLGEAIASQQRFIENAAHQLRTPLAGLKLQAERAARARDMKAIQPALTQVIRSADRTAHLTSQLLALARSESTLRSQAELEPVDLVGVAREVCLDWIPRTLERGMDLEFETTGVVRPIIGNVTGLREMLNNLLDNALRYGRERGHILVAVRQDAKGGGLVLSVSDDGPGIPPGEADRVLERFYRVPGSPGDGCGLGLAIVKEIADVHQADLTITLNPSGGATIAVAFSRMVPDTVHDERETGIAPT
ncbi:MAG: sensor histidine kinase [Methylococcus sp.]